MSKEAYYFSHDANARQDDKILELRAEFGWEGYGLYWAIIEMLRDSSNYTYPSNAKAGLGLSLNIAKDKLEKFLNFCFEVKLLVNDNGVFYSESLMRRMEEIDEKRRKRAEAGRLGGIAKALPKQNPSNAKAKPSKESKVKESKEEKKKEEQNTKPSVEGCVSEIEKSIEGAENVLRVDDPGRASLNADLKKASHTEGPREIFSKARKLFPGKKRGDGTEWEDFEKKYKKDPEYANLPTAILNAITLQIKQKVLDTSNARYIPMFSTWINQKRWEIEVAAPQTKIIPITSKEINYDELAKEYGPVA